MSKFYLCVLIFFYSSFGAACQSEFRVGTSAVSIEPDHSIFSLALGGYGAPSEGRFTLAWTPVPGGQKLKAISGFNGTLYAVNEEDQLLGGTITNKEISWKQYGSVNGIFVLAGIEDKLYGVDGKGQLLEGNVAKMNFSWRTIGRAENVIALTALDAKLYGATRNNQLLVKDPRKKSKAWKVVGPIHDVLSLTEHDGLLYSANRDSTIWKGNVRGESRWMKIARKNGLNYNINVTDLAVLNDRLYALDDAGQLYAAGHSSKGDLSARALAIGSEDKTAVIVGVDLCSFNHSLIREVKRIVWERRRIPPDAILINASHTHFAPTMKEAFAYESFMHRPDSVYMKRVVRDGLVKVIEQALDNMQPARLSFGRGSTQIGRNRSSGNDDSPYDNAVDVIKVEPIDNGKTSVLFLTGCHPVFRNAGLEGFTISANYPGITKSLLEEKGAIDNAIFIQGCGGDINPKDADREKTALKLAVDVLTVLNGQLDPLSGDISYALDTIQIPIEPWTLAEVETIKRENEGKPDLDSRKDVRWAEYMMKQYQAGKVPSAWPVYVQTINVGNWKLVGLSREVVTEYSLAIKALWPGKLVSVAGYSNDVPSYLPASRHINQKTYEGYNSFFWNTQPAILPPNVFDIVIANIERLNR